MKANDFLFMRELMRREAGVALEDGKAYLVELRLRPLAREAGLVSLEELVARLRSSPVNGLHRQAVESLLWHETRFFRDENTFDLLRRWLLPQLLERVSNKRPLAFWSAACAGGQEPYSLALLLKEALPEGTPFRILATDISEAALARAERGVYSALEMNRGLPSGLRDRYFTPEGGEWRIAEEVRRLVEFKKVNLARDWPSLGDMDVIFLKNVLIYFDLETRREVLARVRKTLRPGGTLFLGGTELGCMSDPAFQLVQRERAWCHQLPLDPGGKRKDACD